MFGHDLLIDKFLNRTISGKERKVLENWILESESNRAFFKNRIKDSNQKVFLGFDSDSAYQKFNTTIRAKKPKKGILYHMPRYAAIFVTFLAIGFFAKKILIDNSVKNYQMAVDGENDKSSENNIVITLADGSTKAIASQGKEAITDTDGNIIANKEENTLVFGSSGSLGFSVALNEIFIPHGQTFKLKLSDGTLVWLNAGSRLRFPQNFNSASLNRTVYLEGEAFFNVAKNEDKPFIVNTHEVDIKVLGTKFNISSYESDNSIATTLVEGAVSVYETRSPENELRLTPSFQATYNKFENSFSKTVVDTGAYTAWMQNKLIIDNLKFSEILKKLERMHHLTFINKAENLNDETYKGEFQDESIESILNTISLSTPFKYEINQNIITITE